MKYDFITIGGATEDITFYTNEGIVINNKDDILRQRLLAFEYGAKIKINKAYSSFGGGAANAAVCVSNLGFKSSVIVAIGEDTRGNKIINNFKKNKVDIDLVQKNKDIETGFSLLLVGQENEHIVFSNRAANKELKITEKEIKEINNTNWVYMTSLSGKWRGILQNVFRAKTKIAWNPGHIQLKAGIKILWRYLKKTEVLILNKDEAIELIMSDPKFRNKNNRFLNNIKNLLKILYQFGPKTIIITNGKFGASAYDGKNFYEQPIIKEKKRIDTTGVGDAFGSTFIAGLEIFNGDIQKAMELSAKNTSLVIGEQGAQNGLLKKEQF